MHIDDVKFLMCIYDSTRKLVHWTKSCIVQFVHIVHVLFSCSILTLLYLERYFGDPLLLRSNIKPKHMPESLVPAFFGDYGLCIFIIHQMSKRNQNKHHNGIKIMKTMNEVERWSKNSDHISRRFKYPPHETDLQIC